MSYLLGSLINVSEVDDLTKNYILIGLQFF